MASQDIWDLVGDDETLRRVLAESMNTSGVSAGPPPTSQYGLQEALTDVTITQSHVALSSSCAICAENFTLNEDAKRLPCTHMFHDLCVLQWLTKHNTCPLCRHELPTSDPHAEEKRLEARRAVPRRPDRSMYI